MYNTDTISRHIILSKIKRCLLLFTFFIGIDMSFDDVKNFIQNISESENLVKKGLMFIPSNLSQMLGMNMGFLKVDDLDKLVYLFYTKIE